MAEGNTQNCLRSYQRMKPIAITPGEPAGIGPDILLTLIADDKIKHPIVAIADKDLLQKRAAELELDFSIIKKRLPIIHLPLAENCMAGQLTIKNASYVINTIKMAAEGCMQQDFSAMVTGPVNKALINKAGIPFSGHTEYLAKLSNTSRSVMMLTCDNLRVALLTTHIPLKDVPRNITPENICDTIRIIADDLSQKFSITEPRIAVCGLNPHCGEDGEIGSEEQEIIIPTLKKLNNAGYHCIGPIPADTAFTQQSIECCDIVLALYHDQGLPVIKHKDFHHSVNVTLGLPFVRTSVDHGTAIDLAGTGKADPTSLLSAINFAARTL